MVAVASCFAQILALIDRTDFARAVRQHAAERAAKGFRCWDHFVADRSIVYCNRRGGSCINASPPHVLACTAGPVGRVAATNGGPWM